VAAPLKDSYGPEVPAAIAGMIGRVDPSFPRAAFLREALDGYGALELMARGRHVAAALARHLPGDYERAVRTLVASLGPPLGDPEAQGAGMAAFLRTSCSSPSAGSATSRPPWRPSTRSPSASPVS
jgi:hypothetical protein